MEFVIYIIFGVLLFVLSILLEGKYKFSREENIIFSIIYLLVVSGIFSRMGILVNENIFLIIVVEFFLQLIYISYFLDKDFFNKDDKYLVFYTTKILIGFFINMELINKVSDVFLVGEDLKIIIWIFIFVYLYSFCKRRDIFNNNRESRDTNISKDRIVIAFTKLKIKYGEDIIVSKDSRKLVVYAIMIFNNFNRPSIFRKIDDIIFKINNKPRRLGIMQIMSKKYINDYESINITCKKIDKLYDKLDNDIKVISSYDKDNSKDIINIYEEIKKFCKL